MADETRRSAPSWAGPYVGPWQLIGRYWRRPVIVEWSPDHVGQYLEFGPDVGEEHARA